VTSPSERVNYVTIPRLMLPRDLTPQCGLFAILKSQNRPTSDGREFSLILKNDVKKRAANFDSAVVFDEAEPSEFVHEEADSRTGCTDHIRQHLLADLRNYCLGLAVLPAIGQQ
jgi:hypothetical protein